MSNDHFITFGGFGPTFGIPYCRQHIWRLEKAGLFPNRRRLGKRRAVWSYNEVQEWVNNHPK